MSTTVRLLGAALSVALASSAGGCNRGPSPSHAGDAYRGKLTDDTLVEASSTILLTTADVVVAMDCAPLRRALEAGDQTPVDRAVAAGVAVRLPPGVTLYTPPFSAENPGSSPLVVTDDRRAGRLCTPGSYRVLKS